jgi:hypothetical protein
MRRATFIVILALTLPLSLALRRAPAQQPGPFVPTPGRFVPCPLGGGPLIVLDTWTGRVHLTPDGFDAPAEGAKAWVVDLPEAIAYERPFVRDVSAGRPLQHTLPLSGTGAGASVFMWQPEGSSIGVLDTRSGVHYALDVAQPGPGCHVESTDLRTLSRSVRAVQTGAQS